MQRKQLPPGGNLRKIRTVPDGPPEEIRYLKVKVNKSNLQSLPVMYANYAEVRANPEETYLLLCLRQDLNLKITGDRAESMAEPFAIVMMSTTHAQRFAKAILSQANAYLEFGESENDDDIDPNRGD